MSPTNKERPMPQKHQEKPHSKTTEQDADAEQQKVAQNVGETALKDKEADEAKKAMDDDVDAILDEIDDVLETNAEDFVKSFIQKGGE
jgi:ubiquitin-like protein Pup